MVDSAQAKIENVEQGWFYCGIPGRDCNSTYQYWPMNKIPELGRNFVGTYDWLLAEFDQNNKDAVEKFEKESGKIFPKDYKTFFSS